MGGRKWVNPGFFLLLMASLGFLKAVAAVPPKQDPEALLTILPEVIDLGKPFPVKMEIVHPENMVVIFPDSSTDFGAFELESIQSFPTRTFQGVSTDQVVFQFWCFDIAPMQGLQAPFQYILNGDTLKGLSNIDSVRLEERVKIYSDTLSFRKHQGLTEVREPQTLKILLIGLIVFILLTGLFLAAVLLAKPIQRKLYQWRLEKEWKGIQEKLVQCTSLLPRQKEFVEELNDIWKRYLEPSWGIPLKPLTTPEMKTLIGEDPKTLSEEETHTLLHLNQLSDAILYADQSGSQEELAQLHERVQLILTREFERRKGGAP